MHFLRDAELCKHGPGFPGVCPLLTIVVGLPEPEARCVALGSIGQRNVDKEHICSLGEVKLIYQVPGDATIDRILQQDGMRPLRGAWSIRDMDLCSLKSSKFKPVKMKLWL